MLAEKCNSKNGYISSIRQRTFDLLEKNPLLTAKSLCKLMDLPYRKYHRYMNRLRYEWKCNHRNEHGSKCSIHAWKGWCYIPGGLNRSKAVEQGWLVSRARNRWLLWKDKLGRLQWFETGRVNLYVRRPANLGKAYQLICDGFSFTGLLTDVKVLEQVLASIRFKGAHYVFRAEQRLPKLIIDLFAKSNGIVIKVGDLSHPDSVEVITTYPDWAERNEQTLREILGFLQGNFYGKDSSSRLNYVT